MREACTKDLDWIWQIEKTTFSASCRNFKSTLKYGIEEFPEGFLVEPNCGYVYSFYIDYPLDDRDHIPNGKCLYICTLAVHPKHRREGIAKKLILDLLERHKRTTWLVVHEKWTAAIRLYEDLGFELCFKMKNIFGYSDGLYYKHTGSSSAAE